MKNCCGSTFRVALRIGMKKKKDQWEEEAKDHFVADLKAQGRGDWIVSASDVVVDKQTNRNFDYQLQSGTEFICARNIPACRKPRRNHSEQVMEYNRQFHCSGTTHQRDQGLYNSHPACFRCSST